MEKKEGLLSSSIPETPDIQIRLTRRSSWQPSPRLPDYLIEDELNKLMDPREWKVYRALWRHSIGLRHTPLITAGYAEISSLRHPFFERTYEKTLCYPAHWSRYQRRYASRKSQASQ